MSKRPENNFEIDFDHFQFLIGDRIKGPLTDTSSLWDRSQVIGTLADAPEIVGISTVRYGGRLKVAIQIVRTLQIDCISWNRIGEFEINLPSGDLIVWGPETDELEQSPTVTVSPGQYVGAAYSRGTDRVLDEMETEGPDEYYVILSKLDDEAEIVQ